MARIYTETTIPSFYFEGRTEPEMVARRNWTRDWWAKAFSDDELVTSPAVIAELERGSYPSRSDALALVQPLTLPTIEPQVLEIVAAYISRRLMPADPSGDGLHVAIASFYECEFLATWNCAHLANANKFRHIRQVNDIPGLSVPSLVTPLARISHQHSTAEADIVVLSKLFASDRTRRVSTRCRPIRTEEVPIYQPSPLPRYERW